MQIRVIWNKNVIALDKTRETPKENMSFFLHCARFKQLGLVFVELQTERQYKLISSNQCHISNDILKAYDHIMLNERMWVVFQCNWQYDIIIDVVVVIVDVVVVVVIVILTIAILQQQKMNGEKWKYSRPD